VRALDVPMGVAANLLMLCSIQPMLHLFYMCKVSVIILFLQEGTNLWDTYHMVGIAMNTHYLKKAINHR